MCTSFSACAHNEDIDKQGTVLSADASKERMKLIRQTAERPKARAISTLIDGTH